MVTAKGEQIEASNDSNPDLFWAIRGAGANFGVVTSATYKLNRLINGGSFLHADFYFPAEKSHDYFKIVESFNDHLPANLATIVLINFNASTNEVRQHRPSVLDEIANADAITPLDPSRWQLGILWAGGRGSQSLGTGFRPWSYGVRR